MQITGSNVTIMVKDMDASIKFYEQIGFKILQRWENYYAMMTSEGITIGLHPAHNGPTGSGAMSIGLMVTKIDDAKALLEKNGTLFESIDDGNSGLYVHFKDPDGTALYFVEPRW